MCCFSIGTSHLSHVHETRFWHLSWESPQGLVFNCFDAVDCQETFGNGSETLIQDRKTTMSIIQ